MLPSLVRRPFPPLRTQREVKERSGSEACELEARAGCDNVVEVIFASQHRDIDPVSACQRSRVFCFRDHLHHSHEPRIEECVSARRRRS